MPKKKDKNKVKQVAKVYINNGMDMTKALKAVGDTNLTEGSLYNKSSRWRNSIEIQAELKNELSKFDKSIANDIFCIANLIEVINAKDTKTSDKVNALNVLAKVIGASKEGQQQTNIIFNDYMKDLQSVSVKSMPNTAQKVVIDIPSNSVSAIATST
jgi:hypothetical protein